MSQAARGPDRAHISDPIARSIISNQFGGWKGLGRTNRNEHDQLKYRFRDHYVSAIGESNAA